MGKSLKIIYSECAENENFDNHNEQTRQLQKWYNNDQTKDKHANSAHILPTVKTSSESCAFPLQEFGPFYHITNFHHIFHLVIPFSINLDAHTHTRRMYIIQIYYCITYSLNMYVHANIPLCNTQVIMSFA